MNERLPSTFIIGAGAVATAFAGALRSSGVPVLGLWSRNPAKARAAGGVGGVAAFSSAPPDIMLEADVVLLAVADDAIASVAQMLLGTGLVNKRHVLAHCAGAIAAETAFAAVRERVAGTAVLHPLCAIPDGKSGASALKGATFGVEGDGEGLRRVSLLVSTLKGAMLELRGPQMATYHCAAAMASNLVVAVLDAAVELLCKSGDVSEVSARSALLPLATGALTNAGNLGIPAGLTGPVKRGDVATVASHLEVLSGSPQLVDLYRSLSLRALEIAIRSGLPSEQASRMRQLLSRS